MREPEMTTWDGQAVSHAEPHGASIIVYRQNGGAVELLILHRAHATEPNGDWAWTPPSGARYPDEEPMDCAARELLEETGLRLAIRHIPRDVESWYLYAAEAAPHDEVVLDAEHDQYAWVSVAEAIQRCQPAQVSEGIRVVVRALGL
ncbi:MAG: NUDIX domain-containing protein [Caldilineaceae bacterium]